MPDQAIPVYLINLDRRPDRRAFMEDQLAPSASPGPVPPWTPPPPDAEIAAEVALDPPDPHGPRQPVLRAEQLRRSSAGSSPAPTPAALMLQDDSELSPALAGAPRGRRLDPRRASASSGSRNGRAARPRKLLGPALGRAPPPASTSAGSTRASAASGCYLITRAAAAAHPRRARAPLRYPHRPLPVQPQHLAPRPRGRGRHGHPRAGPPGLGAVEFRHLSGYQGATKSLRARRGPARWYEVNLVPAQASARSSSQGARLRPVDFAERRRPHDAKGCAWRSGWRSAASNGARATGPTTSTCSTAPCASTWATCTASSA